MSIKRKICIIGIALVIVLGYLTYSIWNFSINNIYSYDELSFFKKISIDTQRLYNKMEGNDFYDITTNSGYIVTVYTRWDKTASNDVYTISDAIDRVDKIKNESGEKYFTYYLSLYQDSEMIVFSMIGTINPDIKTEKNIFKNSITEFVKSISN